MGTIVVWALVRYRFPGPAAVRCHRRHSLCAADRGRRHRADAAVCAKGLARRPARRARHQGRVHADRHLHRDGLHRHAVRGAHGAAGADRSRSPRSRRRPRALGANRWQRCSRVILPSLIPALLTGFALAFARAVGEYGSVIFIAGNLPNMSEIAPLLIVIRLSEFRYADATAIAVVMLVGVVPDHLRGQSPAALGANPHAGALRAESMSTQPACTSTPVAGLRAAATSTSPRRLRRDECDRGRHVRKTAHRAGPIRFIIIALAVIFLPSLSCCRWSWCSRRHFRKGVGAYFAALAEPRSAVRDPADAAGGGDIGHAQSGVRRDRGLGDRQIRFLRQDLPDHADRPAVLGQPGDLRSGLRAAVRRAGLFRPLAAGARHPRSCSRCPASCLPPCS